MTRDVVDHAMVRGNPARRSGWVCTCGIGLDDRLACSCGRSYRLLDGQLTQLADIHQARTQSADGHVKGNSDVEDDR